jgi:hypothetical protein
MSAIPGSTVAEAPREGRRAAIQRAAQADDAPPPLRGHRPRARR